MKYFFGAFALGFVIALTAGIVNFRIGYDQGVHTCHVKVPYSCSVEQP